MNKTTLKKYAKLIAQVGANVQKGQDVIIYSSIHQEELVNYIVEECYKLKANIVSVRWDSDKVSKTTMKRASVKALSNIPEWRLKKEEYINKTLPAFIYISDEDPDAMKGIDQAKSAKVSMATYPIIKPYRDARENKYQWVIAAAPSAAWAKKVFPNETKSNAMKKLWDAILYTSRVTEDPIKAWKEHNDNFKKHCELINSLHLVKLHYTSKNGTDLTVGLLENANWLGGGETTLGSNIYYNPNIPTEECFTSPRRGDAEGIVYSTKPLSYNGELIEDFWVRFENGKAVEVGAKKNQALLEQMIKMDETAAYLGECALVPFESPINQTGILFYNTLFDENACCHLALGMGFTNVIQNYEKYTFQELTDMGINDSMIHVDFMIGSRDLDIVGTTKDGKEIQIFKNGTWAI